MEGTRQIDHFGNWLKKRIARIPMRQKEFYNRFEIPKGTYREWIQSKKPPISDYYLTRLAGALSMDPDELEAVLKSIPDEPSEQQVNRRGMGPIWAELPMFDLSVAAGGWTDVTDVGETVCPQSIDHGLFFVHIAGDSMEPKWRSGQVILFECLRDGTHSMSIGKDYYVQRRDGAATFKRLESIDEDLLVFRAINRKKYPREIPCARENIVRMAVALGLFTPEEMVGRRA